MSDPLYDSRTARFDLPLLFAGQAQKEGTVNEVAARIDALLHGAIEGELAAPPISPSDGQAWLVSAAPSRRRYPGPVWQPDLNSSSNADNRHCNCRSRIPRWSTSKDSRPTRSSSSSLRSTTTSSVSAGPSRAW